MINHVINTSVIAIYINPLNFPNIFTAREVMVVLNGVVKGKILGKAETIEEIRKLIPENRKIIRNRESSASSIVEFWAL